MTQVVQYLPQPLSVLTGLRQRTTYLVMTYPTHWEEVEQNDRWRFTKAGMHALATEAGFDVKVNEMRWSLPFDDFNLAGGYGLIGISRPHHAGS
jgi:hypothetical protein